jgi:hypothetical protein
MRKLIEIRPTCALCSHLHDLISVCYNAGYATRCQSHATLVGDSA